ncbi:23S rRNA (uracil(1939)-C(5))-methyltransferase RlmD [Spiribacter salinus]|uniref:23S rRNA (uracil(1939)-C(5))-methyltransferase RlmD n=1 Tax=Spiribacter salinus TaxID=1335746 RepID=UPI00059CA90D|nr:23S rRNA (uracil(1939)-C(5))-methyltransferase RlmD [Spiribacter salinus]
MGGRRGRRLPAEPVSLTVERISHEGRGIAHHDGRTAFIQGALPGETVSAVIKRRRRRQEEGQAVEITSHPAASRVEPPCPHFGICGGCSLQHMDPGAQIAHKQAALAELLANTGGVTPAEWLAALTGPTQGYRRRARLGVKYVPRKDDRVLVGFRERFSPHVADIDSCHILDERVGRVLDELAGLVRGLSIPDRIAQIEVAAGDEAVALVFRNLRELSPDDRAALIAFGDRHGFLIFEQPGNESTVAPVGHAHTRVHYALPDYGLRFAFAPTDFTQVNADINRQMVPLALELLEITPDARVLDLFCGLGNFTLPIAREAQAVIGLEGAEPLVERGRENAAANGLENVRFEAADLTTMTPDAAFLGGPIDRVLLDPPRSGALEVLPAIARLAPERIVYVSCGPATLARDVGELVHQHGYRLDKAGLMDMFPHTGHAEAIALLTRT